MKPDEILKLFDDIDDIKHSERKGWNLRDVKRPRDTIASHSYGSAMLGWALAEEEGFDTEKTIKALLVHDLVMSKMPDYTPEDSEYSSKKELETEKTDELINNLPENIRKDAGELIEELQEQNTEFAEFVKQCDKLDTILQSRKYSEEKGENFTGEFLEDYREHFKTETGNKIWQKLAEEYIH